MPNTLAHLGVQALTTRALVRGADLRWIAAGAVIPDVPWIVQRVVRTVAPAIDPFEVRLYAIAQASLAVSLLLCGALAILAARPRRAFGLLSLNAVLHLLLDAAQTKWANGVHLWAPASWELWNLGWFWPESLPTYVLTAGGLVIVAAGWWRGWSTGPALRWRRTGVLPALLLGLSYLTVPLAFRGAVERADNHHVATLRREHRAGLDVEFDRSRYLAGDGGGRLVTLSGERLVVRPRLLPRDATVSVRGTFADDSTLAVREFHDHSGWPRDGLTYLGLAIIVLVWIRPRGR